MVSYNLYWLVVILGFFALRYSEKRGSKRAGEIERARSIDSRVNDSEIETKDVGLSTAVVREVGSTGSDSS